MVRADLLDGGNVGLMKAVDSYEGPDLEPLETMSDDDRKRPCVEAQKK